MRGHPHRGTDQDRHQAPSGGRREPHQAAEADAAAKLYAAGILPLETSGQGLGYTPSEIEAMRGANVRQALDAAPLTLPPAPEPAAA